MYRLTLLTVLMVLLVRSHAQQATYNFRHVGATQGLSDGVVRAIGQDRYGYIWMGTLSGLNRFNGYTVESFFNDAKDSLSLPASQVFEVFGDSRGNLWIGCGHTLVRYDHARSAFLKVKGMEETGVVRIVEDARRRLYLLSTKGLAVMDPVTQKIDFINRRPIPDADTLLTSGLRGLSLYRNRLYVGTDNGLVLYNTETGAITKAPLPRNIGGVKDVCEDANGNVWASFGDNYSRLLKTDTAFRNFRVYDEFKYSANGNDFGGITSFLVDQEGGFWFATSLHGIVHYNAATATFESHVSEPLRKNSLSSTHVGRLFQGRNGFIWCGSEGYGANYFHPRNNLFQTIVPEFSLSRQMTTLWARALVVDPRGDMWMGMGEGVLRLSALNGSQQYYRNSRGRAPMLHATSVRSLAIRDEYLWIGTADGVNRLNRNTGRMDFLLEKDSLPKSFYWSLLHDTKGTLWFGSRSGLFYLKKGEQKVRTLASNGALAEYRNFGVRSLFEDSRGRIWIGGNGRGLLLYDEAAGKVKQWQRTAGNDSTVINNTIIAIAEDRKGIMWFSSATGLTSYDPRSGVFRWFTKKDGLPSMKTSGLLVDREDRLWIGTTSGLVMLDAGRTVFKSFDLLDGLPIMEFADMQATCLPDGRFAFPTMNGYVAFDPLAYSAKSQQVPVFLSSLSVLGKEYAADVNAEEIREMDLRYYQNFLTLTLTAFNYSNPDQTWYAYKLEGFDRDWIYTKDRVVHYTNIPGGRYRFLFKATADPNNWNVPVKTLSISIGTIFYKTWWFWILVFVLVSAGLFLLYRNRMYQQRRIFLLQTKAQALEKEKARVMYESLKQQLNPHFLFNSLTSLGSLIRVDQKLAGQFLDGMSKIYRYILKSSDNELVALGEEIRFVQNYIRLQQTRFETGLEVDINVDEIHYHKKIAPVTLQNLIENAIKHNIIDDESPLRITINVEGNYLVTSNNLQRKKVVDTSNKQGLVNLRSLYRYLTNYPIEITEDGEFFTIKIPLL